VKEGRRGHKQQHRGIDEAISLQSAAGRPAVGRSEAVVESVTRDVRL